jgi:carboxymethylenebutenolidase
LVYDLRAPPADWDERYRGTIRKFAHHGFAAISHNLYHRAGGGKADDVAAKIRAKGGDADAEVVCDTRCGAMAARFGPDSVARSQCRAPARVGHHTFLFACYIESIEAAVDLLGRPGGC